MLKRAYWIIKIKDMNLDLKEFRVGNLVSYNSQFTTISGIYSPEPDINSRFNGVHVVEIFPSEPFNVPLSEISPLKISGEILIDLGFSPKDLLEEYNLSIGRLQFSFRRAGGSLNLLLLYEGNQLIPISRIEFVHQIQNLIFSLTGQELKIGLQ